MFPMHTLHLETEIRRSHINILGYAHDNKAWDNVTRWERRRLEKVGKPLENARRLQALGKRVDLAPNVADVYRETDLRKLTRFELFVLIICALAAILSGIAAAFQPIYLTVTVVTAWFASIAFRFYRHHLKCHWYLMGLDARKCPHCGKALVPLGRSVEMAIPSRYGIPRRD
jgi:hypothetical protein